MSAQAAGGVQCRVSVQDLRAGCSAGVGTAQGLSGHEL